MTSPELAVAVQAGRRAGLRLKERLGRVDQVRHKGRRDLVTEADLASQTEIISTIRDAFPDHRFLAEEAEDRPDLSGPVWIIDPLDGTTNYVHGLPAYSVSIALARDGELQCGVVYDPERDELFSAQRGQGAWLAGRPIRVSAVDHLIEALLVTGFAYDIESRLDPVMIRFSRLMTLSQGARRLGSAALDLAYVACGRFEAFWEEGLKPWDVAAGVLLVREAGGRVTRFDGQAVDILRGEILASNGLIHQPMIQALKI